MRNIAAKRKPDVAEVTVGGAPAQIVRGNGVVELDVYRPWFEVLVSVSVSVNSDGPFTDDDLIRIAVAITKR